MVSPRGRSGGGGAAGHEDSSKGTISAESGGFLSPTWTIVLLKLPWLVMDTTLSALLGGRGGRGARGEEPTAAGMGGGGRSCRCGGPAEGSSLSLSPVLCFSSSEVELDEAYDEEPHFLFNVLGRLQLSRYRMMLSRQLICW